MGTDQGEADAARAPRTPHCRVFLSHTGELAEYPMGDTLIAAAKRAVERAGHVSVEMKTWTASAAPSADVCPANLQTARRKSS